MSQQALDQIVNRRYDAGFVTDIETDTIPPGLSEDVIRLISAKKGEPEWLTDWRLAAYRHWLTMTSPEWAKLELTPIDFATEFHGLEMSIVAEGVETQEQLGFLAEVGCDAVQGYFIGKPAPIGQYAALVGRNGGDTIEPARKTG